MSRRSYMKLEKLADLNPAAIKAEWAQRFEGPAPNISPELLRLGIAYRIQEQRMGGIDRSTRLLLRQVAALTAKEKNRPTPRKLTPGTKLIRDWHGVGHSVTVLKDGFEYDGKHWKTLTSIASTITGGHRSGPLFFGLVESKK